MKSNQNFERICQAPLQKRKGEEGEVMRMLRNMFDMFPALALTVFFWGGSDKTKKQIDEAG